MAARWGSAALAGATAAYTAAHGHPLAHGELRGTRQRWRWTPSTRLVLSVVLALAILVGGGLLRVAAEGTESGQLVDLGARDGAASQDQAVPVADADAGRLPSPDTVPQGAPPQQAVPQEGPTVVLVHVVGQVLTPGLVELPSGARVAEALTAAGGATEEADLRAVNLARVVVDGEQVVVPGPGEVVPRTVAAPGVDPGEPSVDLNSATSDQLQTLPGVGPVLAERILQWRADHGRFMSVAELTDVTGVGPALLARLQPLVRV